VALWALWAVSWTLAAVWSRRTVARPSGPGSSFYAIPQLAGAGLLFRPFVGRAHWPASAPFDWLLFAATAVGFAFAWWARLWLGSLWSGTVTRKADHRIVDTGPYGVVRHPIYTGVIAAGFALALELRTLPALAGAALMTVSWWMKARVEEGFLAEHLGAEYEAYRRRTPMLFPALRAEGP
jgi:protein-S-isoprenylcysteine O-methyltransferase Ste14